MLLKLGLMDFHIKILDEMNSLGVHSGTRLRSSLRSEASNPRQLKVLIAAVRFLEANWPLK